VVAQWFSIEVLDGAYSAAGWADAFGDSLVGEAIAGGARDWAVQPHAWGLVFEVEFGTEEAWTRFRDSLAVRVALDAVPDPLSGLIIYKGRGGSAGGREPRRARPLTGAGAAALPLPFHEDSWSVFPPSPRQALGLFG